MSLEGFWPETAKSYADVFEVFKYGIKQLEERTTATTMIFFSVMTQQNGEIYRN